MPVRLAEGLAAFEASLAISLLRPTPTEQPRWSSSATRRRMAAAMVGPSPSSCTRPGHVEEGLVEGDPLDQRGHRLEDGVQLAALLDVAVEATVHEDRRRAEPPGHRRRHGRVHAEPPGLVGAGRHHAASPRAAHDDRQAGQGRVVEHLHRGEEGVHVDVEDDPLTPVAGPPGRTRPRRPGPGSGAVGDRSPTEAQPPEPLGEGHPGLPAGILGPESNRRRGPLHAVGELAPVAGHRLTLDVDGRRDVHPHVGLQGARQQHRRSPGGPEPASGK